MPVGSVSGWSVRAGRVAMTRRYQWTPVLAPSPGPARLSSAPWTTSSSRARTRQARPDGAADARRPACSRATRRDAAEGHRRAARACPCATSTATSSALETEVGLPIWAEDGRWGVDPEAFLPPLKLTLQEAMAVFLGARLMVRYADKYDPDLASAFEKLAAALPETLRDHVARSLDVLQDAPLRSGLQRPRPPADPRLGGAARRRDRLRGGGVSRAAPGERSRRTVRPFLIEPSLQTHALYLIGWDEDRDAMRTFKIERIREVRVTPRAFEPPEGATLERDLRRGWDIIADQPATEVVLPLLAGGRGPGPRDDLAPPADDGADERRRAALALDRQRRHRDPALDPVLGRRRGGPRARRAPDRRSARSWRARPRDTRPCSSRQCAAGDRSAPATRHLGTLRVRGRCAGAPESAALGRYWDVRTSGRPRR